jgi:transcription initiation factor TFIIB
MASHASDKQLTKKELGVGTGVADVTIRTVYKLMHPRAAELFPENFNLDLTKLPRS